MRHQKQKMNFVYNDSMKSPFSNPIRKIESWSET